MKCTSYLYDIKIKVMKLYTEEQMKLAYGYGVVDGKLKQVESSNIIEHLIPIELPSDEEIENRAESYCDEVFSTGMLHGASNHTRQGYIQSAKWMKKQILNQNKTRVFGESDDKQFWSDKPNQNK
jgi:hypothetical protein